MDARVKLHTYIHVHKQWIPGHIFSERVQLEDEARLSQTDTVPEDLWYQPILPRIPGSMVVGVVVGGENP